MLGSERTPAITYGIESAVSSTHVFYLAPTGSGVGLTSACLGLVRALDRVGRRVAFFKPIRQPGDREGPERSTSFVRATSDLDPPDPLSFDRVEQLMLSGQQGRLLEEVIERFERVPDVEAVVVEGLVPTLDQPGMEGLNAEIARALDAEVILVAAVGQSSLKDFSERLEATAALFGGPTATRVLGSIVNRLNEPAGVSGAVRTSRTPPAIALDADRLRGSVAIFAEEGFELIGAVPWQQEMVSPRTADVAAHLGARLLNEGEMAQRRVVDISLCARTVGNLTHRLRPDTLIITPGDRDDVVLATCMAALNGVPLAGLLLTGGSAPSPGVLELCRQAFAAGLPLLSVDTDSYITAAEAAAMDQSVPIDDLERIERVMETVAGYLDTAWLDARIATDLEPRLSPAAFRHRLVTRAREAKRLIVLPEGAEPRTVTAAAICQERAIARCLLLADPAEVHRVAAAQGVTLPDGLEIVEPTLRLRERYVAPMVALRRHKGLTEPVARQQLEDPVVLGTMMLAQGEVDGLVSGAIHTTANTVRPAFQLIKTHPAAALVSSIFFMLLPDGVLIYGDCAINPDPEAAELADIAIQSAESALAFGIEPRVAMISYSTGVSGTGSDVDKVREATRIARERRPELLIDGPLQYDAASTASVARTKAPDSPVAGRATVLIFPDLNTGNTTYKAVQRSAGVVSIGPMLQGLRRPVNDLSRGALIDDIVYTIALTAIQAEQVASD